MLYPYLRYLLLLLLIMVVTILLKGENKTPLQPGTMETLDPQKQATPFAQAYSTATAVKLQGQKYI